LDVQDLLLTTQQHISDPEFKRSFGKQSYNRLSLAKEEAKRLLAVKQDAETSEAPTLPDATAAYNEANVVVAQATDEVVFDMTLLLAMKALVDMAVTLTTLAYTNDAAARISNEDHQTREFALWTALIQGLRESIRFALT
jgi:hypothetical protein